MKFLIWLSSDCTSLEEVTSALTSGGHEIGILLVQDGVFMADKGCPESKEMKSLGIPIYAVSSHVAERGIGDRLVMQVELVDSEKMVELIMEDYDRVISL